MKQYNNIFKYSFIKYFTLILLVYCLIPFESINVSDSLIIRMSSAFILTLIAIYYHSDVQKKIVPVLIFLLGIILVVFLKSFSFKFFLTLSAIVFGLYCATSIAGSVAYKRDFVSALKMLIYISVALLLFQIFWYQLTSDVLKLHEVIFPISVSRVEEYDYFNRLGGMFIEPGTHANWVYSFFLLYIIIDGKLDIKLGFLVGLSLVFTISLWGVIVGLFLTLICTLNLYKVKNLFFVLTVAISVFALFFIYINSDIYNFLENKMFSDGVSKVSKLDAWAEFFNIYDDIILFGYGFDPIFCIGCVAVQDAGLILSLFVIFGIIPGLVILLILFYGAFKIGGIFFLILFLPLVFTKLFYWDYVLWLIFFVIILRKNIKFKN